MNARSGNKGEILTMPAHTIRFLPHQKAGSFKAGATIRDAALALGILIESSCAGIGTCAQCKVVVKGGASPLTDDERALLTPQEHAKGVRLSCRALLQGDSLCIVPPSSLPTGDQILVDGLRGDAALDPDLRKAALTLPPPLLGQKHFDFEQALAALRQQGVVVRDYAFEAVRDLSRLLHAPDRRITAVIDRETLRTFEPGDTTGTLYGVALDVGTTTVAAKLVDLNTGHVAAVSSAANPQHVHGADVVTRLRYVAELPSGLKQLHRLIIKLANALIAKLAESADVSARAIYKVVVVGNTVMQHLALNVDPRRLGASPYPPAFQGPATLDAKALGLKIHPAGVVYAAPNLSGYVGSDITAVLTVLDLDAPDACRLAVDLGTNGEMVLGANGRLLCCSSPAGPAWEGSCITWGMRATHGAIERAEIADGALQLRTIGSATPTGICGSGLIDLICAFLRVGVIEPSGRIRSRAEVAGRVPASLASDLLPSEDGPRHLAIAAVDNDRSITLTQQDVREVQLAKGAIAAGIRLLRQAQGVAAEEIDRVYIAGAFGNHVRGEDAVDLGLIPDVTPDKITFVGNAALTGAEAILRSRQARARAERIAAQIEYLEIAGRADFQDCFVEALPFALSPID